MAEEVYVSGYQQGAWQGYLAATAHGLCRATLPGEPLCELERWLARFMPQARRIESAEMLEPYAVPLRAYLDGRLKEFSLPLDMRGTRFQISVWRELLRIPYGTTCSYQDIAVRIGRPTAVRAVGAANGANPLAPIVPCHRVIGKNGTLTGYGGGLETKRWLLSLEGLA